MPLPHRRPSTAAFAALLAPVFGAVLACDAGPSGSGDAPDRSDGTRAGDVAAAPDSAAPTDASSTQLERRVRLRPSEVPPGPAAPDLTPAPDTLAPGVRGRVAVGDVGLGAVDVVLRTEDGGSVRTRTSGGRKDLRGYFGFAPVSAGTHRVRVELPEPSGVEVPDTALEVTVATVEQATRVDFPARLRRAAVVEGEVRRRDGTPLEGARVEVSGQALDVHRAEPSPPLGSLSWRGAAATGPDGRYALEVPPGRYRLRIWRPDDLDRLRFLRLQYDSRVRTVPPGDTARANFDFAEFRADDCTAGSLRYGSVVTREFGDMACAEALHPTATFVETWTFRGRAGDRVVVSTDLSSAPPLLLAEPDSTLVASAADDPDEPTTLRATLERDGPHLVVVTQERPLWTYSAPYTLELGLDGGYAVTAESGTGASGGSPGGPGDPPRR